MKDYIITCSSTCDLTTKYLEEHNNPYISFYYYLDDKKCIDNFYNDKSVDEFYDSLKKYDAKTSQPSPEQFVEVWSKIIEEGKDIIHIELSSGISGAYNSALIAKDIVLEKYTDAKLYVCDSLCASSGYGLLVDIANKIKNNNESIDVCFNKIEDIKHNISHIFCTSDLSQLLKGGRISKTAFTFGKLLNIVPVMHVNNIGKLEPVDKLRGLQNAIKKMVEMISNNFNFSCDLSKSLFISHSNCKDIVDKFLTELKNKVNNIVVPSENIFNIGTVIGSHTGQGTLAVFFVGNSRV